MEMVEVKTAELVGAALDWAVAMATGWESDRPQDGQIRKGDIYALVGPKPQYNANFCMYFSPSTDWSQGGELIDPYNVKVFSYPNGSGNGRASARFVFDSEIYWQCGETPLIALCRAIVSAKLGDLVQVPSRLFQVTE